MPGPIRLRLFVAIILTGAAALLQADVLDRQGINARAVHELGLTGAGVRIALLSHGNVRASHAAFERANGSAITNHDFTGLGLSRSGHDTNMAGLLISQGSQTHREAIGAAFGAEVHSARIIGKEFKAAGLSNALETLITKHNCRVIVTGIQLPADKVAADGTSMFSKIYDYYAETYDVIFANAAGNVSPQITVFGDCYNGITTAALKKDDVGVYVQAGMRSNSGPTADGRKKPEVAAPAQGLVAPSAGGDDVWNTVDPNGLGLTSFAGPFTAATAALLLEAAAKNTVENDDHSEVIKAVIVNSLSIGLKDKQGNPAGAENAYGVWNADVGYGKLDALKACKTLMAGPIAEGQASKQRMGWVYGVMAKKSEHAYKIEAAKGQRLVVTVTWHRKLDKVGGMFIEEPVRFALEVKVVSPSGQIVLFETAGQNNLMKADCAMNEDGVYQIVLRNNTEADGRDYGMAWELITDD